MAPGDVLDERNSFEKSLDCGSVDGYCPSEITIRSFGRPANVKASRWKKC
jgi:hypothetical protein